MNILIIDGQGGQLGSQIIKAVIGRYPDIDLTAVGTNAAATTAMVKAGAKKAATGENPIIVACREADVIIGPIGIVIADALLGEITPDAAKAVGQSDAVRILIPINKCENLVAGVTNLTLTSLIEDALAKLDKIINNHLK
ncbi:MAG: DUF3842 family protein [Clostridia bacterium]|nr:DUF3842 family protein [Clostridia bacterium]